GAGAGISLPAVLLCRRKPVEIKLGKQIMSNRSVIRGRIRKAGENKNGRKTEKTMCGRYYVDDETAREIRRLVLKLDQRFQGRSDQNMTQEAAQKMYAGSLCEPAAGSAAVFPSQKAMVIM